MVFIHSRDNPPRIKDGAYVTNFDEYSDIGTHWVALYVHNNDFTYFDSFGVEHIPKEIKWFIYRSSSSFVLCFAQQQVFSECKHMIQ